MRLHALIFSLFVTIPAWAAGPSGFGPIKIGITKEDLNSIRSGDVRLDGELEPVVYKSGFDPIPGVEKLTASIASSSLDAPLRVEFSFKDGLLAYFIMTIDSELTMNKIVSQISQKYGKPEIVDEMKEEQCIYRNGTNFKIKSGTISSRWSNGAGKNIVDTAVTTFVMDSCPVNLRSGSVGATVFRSLRIGEPIGGSLKKSENFF